MVENSNRVGCKLSSTDATLCKHISAPEKRADNRVMTAMYSVEINFISKSKKSLYWAELQIAVRTDSQARDDG